MHWLVRYPSRSRITIVALALSICGLGAAPCMAVIEAVAGAASIRFAESQIPPALSSGDFTVFAWVRPATTPGNPAGVIQIPGLLDLWIDGPRVKATLRKSGAVPAEATAIANQSLVAGEWALLAVSLRTSDGRFFVFAQGESTTLKVGAVTDSAFASSAAGPPTGPMAIGAHPAGLPSMVGAFGTIAVRNHWINAADFDAVWSSRRYLSPFDVSNAAAGGHLTGEPGCTWMINHAMTTFPFDAGVGGISFDRAAVVGQPVGTRNVHVFTRTGPLAGWFAVVRPVTAAEGFVYRSHRDAPFDGFFTARLPGSGTPLSVSSATAPKARQLITGPRQLLKVMTSANSRAVGWHDGSVFAPSNYAHGFIERNLGQTAGILLRPAILSSGGGRWFGYDLQPGNPWQSAPGTIVSIAATQGPLVDFTRFWTGSSSGSSRGPGEGLFLRPDAFYSLRCKPEPGSLIREDAPLVVRAHVLRFPGSSSITWRPDKGVLPGAPGTTGPAQQLTLDTTTLERTLIAGDHMPSATTLRLLGNLTGSVQAGDAVFVSSGAGAGSIAVSITVAFDGSHTVIELAHPMHTAPQAGSVMRFGPWGYDDVTHTWPGLPPSDPEVFRGLEISAGADGAGAVVFAYSAWRPGVNGFAFGTAGWGGNGYERQLGTSNPGSHAAWMAETEADVWIQVPAQQWSTPSSMGAFADAIRTGLPGVELVWAGELQHESGYPASGPSGWQTYILDQAGAFGAVGLASFEHPRLGDFREQMADGLRKDGEHLSQRGNRIQADVWTEMLRGAAVDPCLQADLNFDGQLNLADFGAFQTLFATGDPLADMNGDGVLNLADFGAFQTKFASGC